MKERGEVLTSAIKVINGERQNQYGSPEDSFLIIAQYWTTFLGTKLTPGVTISKKDIAIMMTLFKIAREQNQAKWDNLIDAAGYIGIAGDIAKEEGVPEYIINYK